MGLFDLCAIAFVPSKDLSAAIISTASNNTFVLVWLNCLYEC